MSLPPADVQSVEDGLKHTASSRHNPSQGSESGTAIVEFAIIVPLLFSLIFGMFSGGIAYNRKLALTNGVREGSRYAATLAVAQAPAQTPACSDQIDCWLAQVATVTQQASEGELGSSVSDRLVCVAYVYPAGSATNDRTKKLVRTSAATDTITTGATCFTDGRPASERRVQVTAQRDGKLEFLVQTTTLTLKSQSVTRFEAIAS